MNTIMNEILARDRSRRIEQEINARQLIKNSKADRPARKKSANFLKNLSSRLFHYRVKKTHFKASTKAVEALD